MFFSSQFFVFSDLYYPILWLSVFTLIDWLFKIIVPCTWLTWLTSNYVCGEKLKNLKTLRYSWYCWVRSQIPWYHWYLDELVSDSALQYYSLFFVIVFLTVETPVQHILYRGPVKCGCRDSAEQNCGAVQVWLGSGYSKFHLRFQLQFKLELQLFLCSLKQVNNFTS